MPAIRHLLAAIPIGVVAALALILVSGTDALVELEHVTWDVRARLFAEAVPAGTPIVIIAIDDESIRRLDEDRAIPWPWPRQVYRYILDFCRASGARAVAFDMFFPDANQAVEGDELFGEAIARTPSYIGALPVGAHRAETAWPDDVSPPDWKIEGVVPAGADRATAEFDVPEIAGPTRWRGHVDAVPDADGVIRRVTPVVRFDGHAVPLLGLAASMMPLADDGLEPSPLRIEPDAIVIDEREVPVDRSGQMIVRFRSPGTNDHAFTTIPALSVVNAQSRIELGEKPDLPLDTFEDAYVIVGVTASALFDHWPSPLKPMQPGVEFHASVLENVLNDAAIGEAPRWAVAAFTIVASIFGALLVLVSRTGRQTSLVFLLVLPVPCVVGLAAYRPGVWWPIAAPQTALLLSMVAAVIVNYATEGRQRRFIRGAFRHYLSERVIAQMLADPSKLSLGGERRELTIFFSDLAGFSSLAESLDAQTLGRLLNDYLDDMTEIILEEEGTIDKYEGDAIIAFWNAPVDQPDHAERACRAAVRCRQRLADRQAVYCAQAGAGLVMRIGIHTGEVGVGNFGSRHRFDYTVIGHAANLASRLEGANKHLGTSTLVSEDTWTRLADIDGREIGLVRVAGVETPIRVFELLDDAERAPRDAFRAAIELARTRRSVEAVERLEQWPADPVAKCYAQHLREAGDAWDGVWNLGGK